MAKPKREDVLYSFIRRSVRNALDLEYAIRASELISGEKMKRLRVLGEALTQHLIRLGTSREEVEQESLLDFVWDALQLGFFMVRQHTRQLDPEIFEILLESAAVVRGEFAGQLHELAIPAASYFRICDLLSGNDIPRLIERVKAGMKTSSRLSKGSQGPLAEFGFGVREPVHLHPSFRFGALQGETYTASSFEVDHSGEFDLLDWRRQMNEFQYHFALCRAAKAGSPDETARALMGDFLWREQAGEQSESDVPGLDSLMPLLTGLYCWDRYKTDGTTLKEALDEAVTLYPADVGVDNMRLNYRNAAKRIEDVANRFRKIEGRQPTHAVRGAGKSMSKS